jgi:hypothetical protein
MKKIVILLVGQGCRDRLKPFISHYPDPELLHLGCPG